MIKVTVFYMYQTCVQPFFLSDVHVILKINTYIMCSVLHVVVLVLCLLLFYSQSR